MGVDRERPTANTCLRFRRFAEFIVSEGGRSVRWRAPSATRPETIRHLLLDQVMPAVAFEHSLIGLHASAVVVDGQGIAFAGPASRGKSTLAASFAAGRPRGRDRRLSHAAVEASRAARGAELSVASIVEGYGRSTAWHRRRASRLWRSTRRSFASARASRRLLFAAARSPYAEST